MFGAHGFVLRAQRPNITKQYKLLNNLSWPCGLWRETATLHKFIFLNGSRTLRFTGLWDGGPVDGTGAVTQGISVWPNNPIAATQ